MFNTKELKDIDCTHFDIINAGCFSVTLRSKDTGHYWHIVHLQYPTITSCRIQHKHKQSHPFHNQGSTPTLGQAIAEIKAHDYYHLHIRPLKKTRKGTNKKSEASQ